MLPSVLAMLSVGGARLLTNRFARTLAHARPTEKNKVPITPDPSISGVEIWGFVGCLVADCTAWRNQGDGFRVSVHSQIRGCTAEPNGRSTGDGAGIHAEQGNNRIEGNSVTINDRGIHVTAVVSNVEYHGEPSEGRQNVVLARRYVLESSRDGRSWIEAVAPFLATSESITNEFDTDLTGRFFRVREIR